MNTVTLNSNQKPEADWNYGDIVVIGGEAHIITQTGNTTMRLSRLMTGDAFTFGYANTESGIKHAVISMVPERFSIRYIGPCDITLVPKVQA